MRCGFILGGRSDSDCITYSEMRELEFEGKNEPGLSALVSDLKLVCVLIHFKDLEDLGNYIEIFRLVRNLVQSSVHIRCNDIVLTKVLVSPLLDVAEESCFILVKSKLLARISERSIFVLRLLSSNFLECWLLISREETPWAIVIDISIELSLLIVDSELSSVNSNHISDSVNNGEIFKCFCKDGKGSVIACITGSLLVLNVKTGVNNFEVAKVKSILGFVGERSINDDSIEVM